MRQHIQKIRVGPVLAGALLTVLPRTGQGQNTPTASTYRVEYYRVLSKADSDTHTEGESNTDDAGDRDEGPRITQQQQQFFSNRARCECNEKLEVRIQSPGGQGSIPNGITDIRVGLACDEAMKVGSPYPRCVRLVRETSPQLNFVDFRTRFEINWLAHGLANPSNEDLSNTPPPKPDTMCEHPGGSSGIWMCFGNDACTTGDFFMRPQSTSSSNDNTSGTSGGSTNNGQSLNANSVIFDFNPPAFRPVIEEAQSGDGAVELRWDPKLRLDTHGYRVLCADEQGNPIQHSQRPRNIDKDSIDGTLYFTKNNLCDEGEPEDNGTGTTGTSGSTGEGTTGGTETDSTSTGGESTDESTSGIESSDGSTAGTSDSTTNTAVAIQGANEETSTSGADENSPTGATFSDTDSTETGSEDTGSEPQPDPSDERILTLNWDFICSEHIPATADRVRIEGLRNNKNYKFVLVAYDRVGNPTPSHVKVGIPRETDNLADLCQRSGNCGKQGFCSISSQKTKEPGKLGMILIVIATAFARRRNTMVSRKR